MSALFFLQKTLLLLMLPPAGPLLAMVVGAMLGRRRRRRVGRILFWGGLLSLYLVSIEPVASRLIYPLERQFPPLAAAPDGTEAVVVLTGGTRDVAPFDIGAVPDSMATIRLLEGVRYYRQLDGIPLVICGGRADPARPELSSGAAMARQAFRLGVPPADLILEDGSINTREGAKALRGLLGGAKRIVLVTSAFHMGRSVDFFRSEGFEVAAAPSGFLSEKVELGLLHLIPSADALFVSATAVYECLARTWYLLAGD